ncbi:hypothetical protein BLL52_0245 [Rhodoferax antarcticus ANT.BR]|uniref:Uncharacterized protein n=1 Tax=Rhodoferax antarcticus ANT.BR TaxID=1111071 RepID=A0A1Q8YL16_9BURK|nr:hypothetical protein BLL52_0245 [Rhodoferax antarcticus ANT.BR]
MIPAFLSFQSNDIAVEFKMDVHEAILEFVLTMPIQNRLISMVMP